MPYQIIKRAIERRESLTGRYDDYVRFFSPHVLGDDRIGAKSVLGFQYAGGRAGGLPPMGDWGLFHVVGLKELYPNRDRWLAGLPENKPLHLFSKIDVQV